MSITESNWKNLMKDTIKDYLFIGEDAVPVINFDDYYITSFGRVFSSKKRFEHQTLDKIDYGSVVWKELKVFYTHRYKTVTLVQNGKRKNIPVHKLVYEGFFGAYNTRFFKIVFKDNNPENCRKSNLRLEFRNKSQKTLKEYERQQRLYELLG